MTGADQGCEDAQVFGHGLGSGPHPARRRAAKAALVIGIGRHALGRPDRRGQVEAVGVVVHAVQADDHGPRLARRRPAGQAQAGAVETDEQVRLQARSGGGQIQSARRVEGRGAAAQGHQPA